jgi:GNAT superfamily N-acetyltransferase/glutaredoxin
VLREVAEYPNSFGPLGPHDERIDNGRYTLCMGMGRTWNTVQRQRFPLDELDQVLAEVRTTLRERGRTRTQWEVGSSAPAGLVDALLERGLTHDTDPQAAALVLTHEPPPVGAGLLARRVETFADYEQANAVQWVAFGMRDDEVDEARALLPERWRETVNLMHAVWLDGRLVCAGTSAPTAHGLLLYGGATLPEARGRGAYRALVRARWDEAVARGTPALLTQAGSMSRPILERLGFRRVGAITMLVDDFGATNGSPVPVAGVAGYAAPMTATPPPAIMMLGRDTCDDTLRSRALLDGRGIPYTYLKVDEDAAADAWIRRLNDGGWRTPTILLGDPDAPMAILREPTDEELLAAIGLG